jgi:hypothetical protein
VPATLRSVAGSARRYGPSSLLASEFVASPTRTPSPADLRHARRPASFDASLAPALRDPIGPLERSCCCPAEPVVRVVLPPAGARTGETDLLFCAHHFRACRAGLEAVRASVFDSSGAPARETRSLFAAVPVPAEP